MIEVAGKTNPPLDRHGLYRKACNKFATDYGFKAKEVYETWLHIVLMREFEQRWPRALAEWQALQDVRVFFYSPGSEEAN